MMPACNAHGVDGTWTEPPADRVQEWFDTLVEKFVQEEPELIHATTDDEVAYIASRAEEARLATEASGSGSAAAGIAEEGEVPEETTADQDKAIGEQGDEAAGNPTDEDAPKEQLYQEPPAPPRKSRVLRKAVSGDLVHPSSSGGEVADKRATGKAASQHGARRQTTQQQPTRRNPTRRAATPVAGVARSSQPPAPAGTKHTRTPTPPPSSSAGPGVAYDISAFSESEEEEE